MLVADSEPLRVAAQAQIAASRQGERFGDGSSRTLTTPQGGSDEEPNGFLEAEILDSHRVIERMREAGSEPVTTSDDDLD